MDPSSSHSKWPTLYTVDRARWSDVKRISSILFPIITSVITTTLFVALYATIIYGSTSFLTLVIVFLPVFIAFLGFTLIMKATGTFFDSFFEPPKGTNTSKLIFRRLLGIPPYPLVVLDNMSTDDGKFNLENESIYWMGGPTTLIIYDGTGVYLERGNQFSRTLGPGLAILERYERVRDIVDLRTQTMHSGQEGKDFPRPIAVRTKDGIKIEFNVEIKFHILRPKLESQDQFEHDDDEPTNISDAEAKNRRIMEEMSKRVLYPGDLEAIKKAVERTAVRRRGSEYSEVKWREGVWGVVSGKLARFVTQHYLDELLFFENIAEENAMARAPARKDRISMVGYFLSSATLETLRNELDSALRADFGVTLTDLFITDFILSPEVNELYRRSFGSATLTKTKRIEGNARADKSGVGEEKGIQVQNNLITETADALKRLIPSASRIRFCQSCQVL